MNTAAFPASIQVGDWVATLRTGRLVRAAEARQLEPKVMDLLFLLASRPGEVFSREEVLGALWPGVTVGDDSLARCVSQLRKALDDDAREPRYIATIPKRGYRLIAPVGEPSAPLRRRRWPAAAAAAAGLAVVVAVGWVLLSGPPARHAPDAAQLTSRADDFYFQYQRADNEAARELYERVIARDPDYAPALAGLSNALTQTVIRWPEGPEAAPSSRPTLGEALASGRTRTPEARRVLARARALAERAVRLEPGAAAHHRALGLAAAAQGDFDRAQAAYERAIALDPDAWGALFNLGDLQQIRGDRIGAIVWFERAYDAMGRVYDEQGPRVRPWYAETGALIGARYMEAGDPEAAETWYRRVLEYAPFHPAATEGLARLLADSGDRAGARRLCAEYVERTGADAVCARILAGTD